VFRHGCGYIAVCYDFSEKERPKDLVPMIGQINRVYEVLNGKRPLTLQMIRRLHRELGIPAKSLIRETGERRAA
jgi:HTH-type transcriptional regulator/antitoxin HigA